MVKEIVYVEVEKVLPAPDPVVITKEVESESSALIVVIIAVVVIIILNILLCLFCIRRHKKRIETLETEKKVDW